MLFRSLRSSGNTLTPMIATTLITGASWPVYAALNHAYATTGLAMASDIGIAANCIAMALLLNRAKLVPIRQLNWLEIGKAAISAVLAGLLSHLVARGAMAAGSRAADLKALGLGTSTWLAAVAAGLWLTRSRLIGDLRRRKPATYTRVTEKQTEELTSGLEP